MEQKYVVKINDQVILRETILEEELKRSRIALKRIKDALGAEGMRRLFEKAGDEQVDYALQHVFFDAEEGEYVKAMTAFEVKGVTAEEFLGWWFKKAKEDPDGLNSAHPEHYFGCPLPDGSGQEVLEVNGDMEIPVHFQVHFHQTPEGAPEVPKYPIAAYSTATTMDGRKLGEGVMHQFVTTETGFKAECCNYYAKGVSEEVIHHQQMHLAIEWSNWIEMALEEISKQG